MRRVKVKICGITREKDLEAACSLGADMVGFVVEVSSSPRSINLERARRLIKLVPENVKSVAVMAPQSPQQVLEAYERLKPAIIQLHGEKFGDLRLLRQKSLWLVRALPMPEAFEKAVHESMLFDAILADSYAVGRNGGTGVFHDWSISRRLRDTIHPKPLILAGGLNPENVRMAVEAVRPYAVDVSTGVELSPGVKDHTKIEVFIRRAKEAVLEDDYCWW